MPEILTMIQIQRLTPTPAILAMALLSLVYLTVSDIYALINYVGFATWVNKILQAPILTGTTRFLLRFILFS